MIEIAASSTVHGDRDAVQVSSESPTEFCCFVIIDDGGFVTGEIVGEYPTGKSDMVLRIAEHAWSRRRNSILVTQVTDVYACPAERCRWRGPFAETFPGRGIDILWCPKCGCRLAAEGPETPPKEQP